MSQAETQSAKVTAPRADLHDQIAVTTSSAAHAVATAITHCHTGKPITFQAAGGSVYLIFGLVSGLTVAAPDAATTGSTYAGFKLADGESRDFWIPGAAYLYVKGSAACKLNLYQTSDA
jgi:hypothetical protein